MPKPKIAIFLVNMAAGGAERVVANLLHHLSDAFDFHLLLLNDEIQYDLPEGLTIHYLDNENRTAPNLFDKWLSLLKMPFLAFKLAKYCRKHEIGLVFSLLSRPNYINCLLKWFTNKVRVVISQRTTVSSFYPTQSKSDQLNRFLTRQLYPKANLIVSNSKGTQADLETQFGLKNATSIAYNLFDFERIALQKEENINKRAFFSDYTEGGRNLDSIGQQVKPFIFISVGRLNVVKNYPLLLRAFALLNDATTRLIIVGDAGQSTQDLPRLARELYIENRVVFTGFQANPFQFMAASDAYVLSSDSEGFPNVLIEAMACGLPIISTDCISGPRELLAPQTDYRTILTGKDIEKGDFGLLTPVGDAECLAKAMYLIRADAILRQQFINNNKVCLAQFEKETILKQFKDIFEE
jgi:N-acetylgalactosamine-N,N'-diacetylbacillosaminyl-diphospho-undecaprenol 4-alpha-N-acetylgalactosaminyltransferase